MISQLLQLYMRLHGVSCKDLGEQIGISPSTVSRVVNTGACDQNTMLCIINWLFTAPKPAAELPLLPGKGP